MAGMPRAIVDRAQEILAALEQDGPRKALRHQSKPAPQLSLFGSPSEVEQELRGLGVASMSPSEAITKLLELPERALNASNG